LTALRLYTRETRRAHLLSSFRKILVSSRYMFQEYVRHGLGPDRVQCIPYPVERPSSAPPVRYRRRVLFLGRMTAVKGVELLVQAVAQVAAGGEPIELDLAGDGPVRRRAEEWARRLGVPARFHGWVDQHRTKALFRDGGVLALPSTWPEPFGLVGLEASAHGLPVAAFDVGGVREWLIPGVTGEVAPADPPTVAGLASALRRALDPDHWSALSAGAYAHSARFTPAAHADAIEACLREAGDSAGDGFTLSSRAAQ
jgi:glycosyltransferase involved in cell wall biosynthesis